MQSKGNGTCRPTFYYLKDEKASLHWMVPLSSHVEKSMAIHDKQAKNTAYASISGHPVWIF